MPETSALAAEHVELLSVVRHLSHELRQPLSGIESIAYYLEMVLTEADDKVQSQIARLRQMVQQASWVLEDTVHAVRTISPDVTPLHLDQVVMRLAAELQMRDEYNLHVCLAAPRALIALDASHAEYLVTALLDFFHHVAQSAEPVTLRTSQSGGFVCLAVETESAQGDSYTLRRLLDPNPSVDDEGERKLPLGSIRRIVEVNGGVFHISSQDSGILKVEMEFPVVP